MDEWSIIYATHFILTGSMPKILYGIALYTSNKISSNLHERNATIIISVYNLYTYKYVSDGQLASNFKFIDKIEL